MNFVELLRAGQTDHRITTSALVDRRSALAPTY
jgi:hypothetical protein